MRESELKQRTEAILAFFGKFHRSADLIMSELVKIYNNRVPRYFRQVGIRKNERSSVRAVVDNLPDFAVEI